MENTTENTWKSKALASLGVVRSEIIPSQDAVTDKNRKFLTALAFASMSALGMASADKAYAEDRFAINLDDLVLTEAPYNPYARPYIMPKQPKSKLNRVSEALNNMPGGFSYKADKIAATREDSSDKLYMSTKAMQEVYQERLGGQVEKAFDAPIKVAEISAALGVILNPAASLADIATTMTVTPAITILSDDIEIGKTTGKIVGQAAGVAAGYTILAPLAAKAAAVNAVRGGVYIAERIDAIGYEKAGKAVERSRSRMAAIYAEEVAKIRSEELAKKKFNVEKVIAKVDSDGLSSNADISAIMLNGKEKAAKHEVEEPDVSI